MKADDTQLKIETLTLMAILFMYGIGRIRTDDVVVILLFAIAIMVSSVKYRVTQQARGET